MNNMNEQGLSEADIELAKRLMVLRKQVKLDTGKYVRRIALCIGNFEDLLNGADDITEGSTMKDVWKILKEYEDGIAIIQRKREKVKKDLEKLEVAERALEKAVEEFCNALYFRGELSEEDMKVVDTV